MNTETLKATYQAAIAAIYVPGERYALAKANGLNRRTTKVLRAGGIEINEANALVRDWSAEVRKGLNVDIRNGAGYAEFC
jgi:hypothetical protein